MKVHGRDLIPQTYRALLSQRDARGLLTGIGVSALGDGMSAVTVPWLALRLAPQGAHGVYVGIAIAAYTLPGAVGAVVLRRFMKRRSARVLVLTNCLLRTAMLGAIALLSLLGVLSPAVYVVLLCGSSAMYAWGLAGQYTMLSDVGGAEGRLAANSLAGAQASAAVIVGPAIAGILLTQIGPGWLIALDAASFAFLGMQAFRIPVRATGTVETAASAVSESGFRLLRRRGLLSLIVLTWVFFFLYGPVEDALPVYVADDVHAHAGLLGAYWTAFGIGALTASLITGALRARHSRLITLAIVAGWGACLVPFAFAPVGVTLACFALGGLVYGPFIPLTYSLFQSATTPAQLPSLLAARSALTMLASPLGTAVGGPIVGALGAGRTLTASGGATLVLAGVSSVVWRERGRTRDSRNPERAGELS